MAAGWNPSPTAVKAGDQFFTLNTRENQLQKTVCLCADHPPLGIQLAVYSVSDTKSSMLC